MAYLFDNQAVLRQKRRDVEGSGAKNFVNPTISASGFWVVDFETDSLLAKYVPVDFIQITNNSSADILITKAGNRQQIIKDGTIVSIEDEPLFSISVKDNGGSGITAGTIEIVAEKKRMDADKLAYQQAQESPLTKFSKFAPFLGFLR